MITPALAQAPGAAAGAGDFLSQMLASPVAVMLPMFVIFYVLLIRPQQRRAKAHAEMLKSVRRGDVVVLGGGLVAKVSKVVDGADEVEVEIAEGVRAKAMRSMIAEVRAKTEPVAANRP